MIKLTTLDGQKYVWKPSNEAIIKLSDEQISKLKQSVSKRKSKDIEEGNEGTEGVIIPLEEHELRDYFKTIEGFIKKDLREITLSKHALERKTERCITNEDIEYICRNPFMLMSGRITVKHSHKNKEVELKEFNKHISFEILGVTDNGLCTLAVAFIEGNRLHVITVYNNKL